MRKLLISAAVVTLAALTASFSPLPWPKQAGPEPSLASVSTWDLTRAAKDLPLAEPADPH
ncbi:MAG TPA: hypothetical protein VF601_23400 [Beijerinckiaceae bacterium]|jgi:hypothetical protein